MRFVLVIYVTFLECSLLTGVVWSEHKQMNLIDSLHHNYFVPPLVFGELPLCILTAIVSRLTPHQRSSTVVQQKGLKNELVLMESNG